jgi:hypothetical protein
MMALSFLIAAKYFLLLISKIRSMKFCLGILIYLVLECSLLSQTKTKEFINNLSCVEQNNLYQINQDLAFVNLGYKQAEHTNLSLKPDSTYLLYQSTDLPSLFGSVTWNSIETESGDYDFNKLDSLIFCARNQKMKLILLWQGSFTINPLLSLPGWMNYDNSRFYKIEGTDNKSLSPFSNMNRDAEARVIAALMHHIKITDSAQHTIVMLQLEDNLGKISESRDKNMQAERTFYGSVPVELIAYMQNNKGLLVPEYKKIWDEQGNRSYGTWEEVFGKNPETEKIFMSYYIARYLNYITIKAKTEYNLPIVIDTGSKLTQDKNNNYIPLLLFDLWKLCSPEIDFILNTDILTVN